MRPTKKAVNAEYVERGTTRSGRRFAQANFGHFASINEVLSRHHKLLEPFSGPSVKYYSVGNYRGNLMHATLRFATNYPNIKEQLLFSFVNFFRQHTEDSDSGFEVVVTFNAILSNHEGTSFSVFYGNDYRAGNLLGASPELRHGRPHIVRTIGDVSALPSTFDFEEVARAHRYSFEHSDVRVARFLNVVYLVTRFIPPKPAPCPRKLQFRPSKQSNHSKL